MLAASGGQIEKVKDFIPSKSEAEVEHLFNSNRTFLSNHAFKVDVAMFESILEDHYYSSKNEDG